MAEVKYNGMFWLVTTQPQYGDPSAVSDCSEEFYPFADRKILSWPQEQKYEDGVIRLWSLSRHNKEAKARGGISIQG